MRTTRNIFAALLLIYSLFCIADLLLRPVTTPAQMTLSAEYLAAHDLATPDNQFTRDGCTLWPDTLPWHDLTTACLHHDIAYWAGGSDARRAAADLEFKDAISHTGPLGKPLSILMYVGVRLFGDSIITRVQNADWGYGYNQ